MGLEMEVFEKKMSVGIFSKNFKPIGTRFLTLDNPDLFIATVAVESDGEEVEINVYWHTVVSMPPHFNIVNNSWFYFITRWFYICCCLSDLKRNPEDWCYPEGTKIDVKEKIFMLPHHFDHSLCIQAPYSLHNSQSICTYLLVIILISWINLLLSLLRI